MAYRERRPGELLGRLVAEGGRGRVDLAAQFGVGTLAAYIFASLLFACAMLMMWHHRQTWESILKSVRDEAELAFQRQRYVRRMRTAAIIAVVAIVIPLYRYVESPLAAKFFLAGLTAAIIAMLILALVDLFATRRHYEYQRLGMERSRLELVQEIRRLKKKSQEDTASDKRDTDSQEPLAGK